MKHFVHRNGETLGPYSVPEIEQYLGSGQLAAADLACPEGDGQNWISLSQLLPNSSAPGVAPASVPAPAFNLSPTPAAQTAATPQPAPVTLASASPQPSKMLGLLKTIGTFVVIDCRCSGIQDLFGRPGPR